MVNDFATVARSLVADFQEKLKVIVASEMAGAT
jgi:hypothetical protein